MVFSLKNGRGSADALSRQPILQRLQQKAYQAYLDSHNGIAPPTRNDIFAPSPKDEDTDDLFIFSGKTHTVVTKTAPPMRASRSSKSTSPPVEPSPPPPVNYTSVPAFAGVHPSLVDQLHGFDGHLSARIQHAYHANHDDFALSLMRNPAHAYSAGPQEHRHAHPPRQDQMYQAQAQHQSTQQVYQQQQQQRQMNPTHMYHHSHTRDIMQSSSSSSSLSSAGAVYGIDAQSGSGHWPDPARVDYPEKHYPNPPPPQQPMHHYPGDGAYDGPGMGPDDIGLQETWASFMYQVGSPRPFLDN
jgi:hypothetical protein